MKSIWQVALFLTVASLSAKKEPDCSPVNERLPVTNNLFIITTDGFRWQELFTGADSLLVNNDGCTPDQETIKALYWAATPAERRKKLMPFFWNVIAKKGQLYGNRLFGNKINTANAYSKSYPGYNEIFTGDTDPLIASNKKRQNPNTNVLEYLNAQPLFRDKVVAFTSWDVFPFILNEERSRIPVNSGYENLTGVKSLQQQYINAVQQDWVNNKTATRMDELTFLTAKEYLQEHRPRVAYIALGETDEFAHEGRYDLYLQQANKVDAMIAELWHWVQTTEGYANNTTFLITTDHGRGSRTGRWTAHGEWIRGSSDAWFAIMGPGISPAGEIKEPKQQYQLQMAPTIAGLLGGQFNGMAPSLSLR